MMDQELKNIWKGASTQELVKLNHDKLILEMEQKHKTQEQMIKNRDRREILVAIMLIPFFLGIGIIHSALLTKIGAFLMVPVLGFIIYKLKAVKKYKPNDVNTSTQSYLEKLKIYYTMEMDLLKDVLYWYLIPPGICITLITFGMSYSAWGKGIYLVVVIVLYTWVYFMNQKAVRIRYEPLLKSIEENLLALKKE